MIDAFFTEMDAAGIVPEDAFIMLAVKVGLGRLLPTE